MNFKIEDIIDVQSVIMGIVSDQLAAMGKPHLVYDVAKMLANPGNTVPLSHNLFWSD